MFVRERARARSLKGGSVPVWKYKFVCLPAYLEEGAATT